jgi:ribosomal protein L27
VLLSRQAKHGNVQRGTEESQSKILGGKTMENKRYQVVYVKRGAVLATWRGSATEAGELADRLRKAGNIVQVWEHSKQGCKMAHI